MFIPLLLSGCRGDRFLAAARSQQWEPSWQGYHYCFDRRTTFPLGNWYPGPEVFLGLAYAKCEKTREEKGKTSGEFVSDSWFG